MGMDWFPELDWSKLKWQGWLHPDMFEGKVCQLPINRQKGKVWMFSEKELVWRSANAKSEASTIATTSRNAAEKANLASAGFRRDLSSLHIWLIYINVQFERHSFFFIFGRILVNFCQQLKASWGRLKSAWPPNLLRRLLSKMKIGFQNLHRKGWQFTKEVT